MGTIYTVACRDCKKKRDLDKISIYPVYDRDEAISFSESLNKKESMFREGLLLSFLSEHADHDCVFSNEHNWREFKDFEEDADFWGVNDIMNKAKAEKALRAQAVKV